MDLILLAALAFFIFYKLSKNLGRIDEEEKKHIEDKLTQMRAMQEQVVAQMKQQEKISQEKLVGQSSTNNKIEQEILSSLDESVRQNLLPILESCKMSAEFFVSGAKSAFEMVIKAFAAGDFEVLKTLLSDNIFSGFEAAINQRKAEEKTIVTNLISINEAKIISASTLENTALITIKFTSKQINYITDKEGKIIVGRKDEITEVNDIWTFKRELNSPNPNWLVSATNS
jgi:predicted lipid-binding transport protein (Tim44 family)